MRKPGENVTTEEWERIVNLKKTMTWHDIALLLGRSQKSLRTMRYKRKNGLILGRVDILKKRSQAAEQLLQRGMNLREIGAKLGASACAIRNKFDAVGMTSNARKLAWKKFEIRKDLLNTVRERRVVVTRAGSQG